MMMKKLIAMLLALAFLCSLGAAEETPTVYTLSGDGSVPGTFFVLSQGNLSVTLRQTQGIYLNGASAQVPGWGCYHVMITLPDGTMRVEDWKAADGETFTFTLEQSGTCVVEMAPMSAEETSRAGLANFIAWITGPVWTVETVIGGAAQAELMNVVTVEQRTVDGTLLNSWSELVSYGGTRISAGTAPAGYTLTSVSEVTVTLDLESRPSEDPVVFYYAAAEAPVPVPVSTPLPVSEPDEPVWSGKVVSPTGWSTQFVEGSKNPNGYKRLKNLCNNRLDETFFYTYWFSEKTDEIPEITAFFNGARVSKIAVVNGRASDPSEYAARARVRRITARINTTSGSYEKNLSLSDGYTTQPQVLSLGKAYTGVQSIELFITSIYQGEDSTVYEVNISEMRFYQ